ncbi:unnamed protein product, partial [Musa acuminata subsp. burmannicoides]
SIIVFIFYYFYHDIRAVRKAKLRSCLWPATNAAEKSEASPLSSASDQRRCSHIPERLHGQSSSSSSR